VSTGSQTDKPNSGERVVRLGALFVHATLTPRTQVAVAVTAPWTVGEYLRVRFASGTLIGSCLPVGALAPNGHSCARRVAG
jgi:hypothetical protein